MEKMSPETLPLWLDSSFRYFEKHERHLTRYFYTTDVLVMVFDGVLRFEEDGIPVEVRAGEYYIQKHGHAQDGTRESDMPKYYWIHFTDAAYAKGERGLPIRGNADFSVLLPLFRELEILRLTGASLLKISSVFYKILGHLEESAGQHHNSTMIAKVISEVTKDIGKPFSLDEIAGCCGYSKNHVINIFKQETGKTPYAFVNDMKVDMAKQLLLNSDSSLGGIAVECGFGNYTNFYRCFVKTVGQAPAEWRKQHRLLQKSKRN